MLGGIRFGHSMDSTVSEEALDVWSLTDRDGVQSIVDVSFGIFRDRMFELSCFSSCETMLMLMILLNVDVCYYYRVSH